MWFIYHTFEHTVGSRDDSLNYLEVTFGLMEFIRSLSPVFSDTQVYHTAASLNQFYLRNLQRSSQKICPLLIVLYEESGKIMLYTSSYFARTLVNLVNLCCVYIQLSSLTSDHRRKLSSIIFQLSLPVQS